MRQLSEFEPILRQVMGVVARETEFKCEPPLADILRENPRLVVALSHSSPLSWLPSASLLALKANEAGGGARIPMGVMDNVFFHLPFVREVARWLTQADRPLCYQELAERFETKGDLDLVLFPEGSNCFFGHPEEIQEFRSPKFVELAIRAHAPILIGVHTGSEHWAMTLPVSREVMAKLDWLPNIVFDFVERRLRRTGLFALPVLPKPMDRFEMRCELYTPTLSAKDLSTDVMTRKEQIRAEGTKVRNRMIELLEELREQTYVREMARDLSSIEAKSVAKSPKDSR